MISNIVLTPVFLATLRMKDLNFYIYPWIIGLTTVLGGQNIPERDDQGQRLLQTGLIARQSSNKNPSG